MRNVALTMAVALGACSAGGSGSTGATSLAIGGNRSSSTPAASDTVCFQGTVAAVVAPSFTVGTRTVTTDGNTRFFLDDKAATIDAVTVGASVEVKGTVQADASVLATSVEVSTRSPGEAHDDGEDHRHTPDTIAFVATLQSVSDDAKALVVGDLTVTLADTTQLVKAETAITVADLKVGDALVVRGVLRPGPVVAARKIRVVVPGSSTDDDHDDD
jgi:hypothetical protein